MATSVPPHTDEQKRHGCTASHPGRAQAARQADRDGSQTRRAIGSATGVRASPPSSTASAAKRQRERTGPALEPAHPTPGRGVGDPEALGCRTDPVLALRRRSRGRHRWSRSSRGDSRTQTPGAGHGSLAHGGAPAPGDPDPCGNAPRGGRTASSPTRTPSARGTTGNLASGPRLLCRPPRRRRRTACRAIRWPSVATPPWTPSAGQRSTCSGRGPSRSGTAHPRRRRPQRAKAPKRPQSARPKDRASVLRQSRR